VVVVVEIGFGDSTNSPGIQTNTHTLVAGPPHTTRLQNIIQLVSLSVLNY